MTAMREHMIGARTIERWRKDRVRQNKDHTEVLCRVCELWEQRRSAAEIVQAVLREYGVRLTREEPNLFVADAGARGWVRYRARGENELRQTIREQRPDLRNVEVVHTAASADVAFQGARSLIGLLRQLHKEGKTEVHIGLAGGHAMRSLAQVLGPMLADGEEGLPAALVFHAMGAGLNIREPSTGPNALFTYLRSDGRSRVARRFVGLHGPAIVSSADLPHLRQLESLHEAYSQARLLDVVVTSASLWDDPHSLFHQYMSNSAESLRVLEGAGCIGDLLWQPLGNDGPIDECTAIRTMTLMQLTDFPAFLAQGKRVLLVLGPCSKCAKPKGPLLSALLRAEPPIVSDLVVDSRTVRAALDIGGSKPLSRTRATSGARRRRPRGWRHDVLRNGLDYEEMLSAICGMFAGGHVASEVRELMGMTYGVTLQREEPYLYMADAMTRHRLLFEPPKRYRLQHALRKSFDWLRTVRVLDADGFGSVAGEAARVLLDILRHRSVLQSVSGSNVHLGFAGGEAMRQVAVALAEQLLEPSGDLPDILTFHALVSGFDVGDPTTDPNAFFSCFTSVPPAQVERRFVGLHAPPVVEPGELARLQQLGDIREAYESAGDLDVIVTSASHWSDPDSMLHQYMSRQPEALQALSEAGARGDMLWQPISLDGPVPLTEDVCIRPMTLVALADLPQFIRRGARVLLTLGPCGKCGRPKDGVLEMILRMKPHLVTDLIVDSSTAERVIRRLGLA